MALDEARYTFDTPPSIEMVTWMEACLGVAVHAIDVGPGRVDLTGSVSWDTWLEIVRLGAFHVDLEPGEVPEGDGPEVQIVLTLRRAWIDRFGDGDVLVSSLLSDDQAEHAHLVQTEAWLLASAMRELSAADENGATSAGGYRTRWAPPLY